MSKINQIKEQIKAAMKSKDTVKRDILRLILGECNNHGESNESVMKVAKKIIKSNSQTIEALRQINSVSSDNLELLKLESEINILSQFLPQIMSEHEMIKVVSDNNLKQHIIDAKNEGQAMGIIMKHFKNNGDGGLEIHPDVVKRVILAIKNN